MARIAVKAPSTLAICLLAWNLAWAALIWSLDQISTGPPPLIRQTLPAPLMLPEQDGGIGLFCGPSPTRRLQLCDIIPVVERTDVETETDDSWLAVMVRVLLELAVVAFWYAVIQSNLTPTVTLRW